MLLLTALWELSPTASQTRSQSARNSLVFRMPGGAKTQTGYQSLLGVDKLTLCQVSETFK